MKRLVGIFGISMLLASGFLPLHAEARGATSRLVEVRDQDLVRDVQRQLKAQGFYPGAVDGNLGSQTASALRAYQRSYRLPETGRVDEATLQSLLPERSEVSRTPEMSHASVDLSNREVRRDAQRQLKALGFDPGSSDGTFGPQTEAALRAYQHAYRLPENGRLDDTTARSLLREQIETSRTSVDLSNREVRRDAQRQLKALGFDPGSTDGALGPQTEAALRAYQHAYRLPETGRLDEVTLRSLLPEMRQGALR